jgi:hypothetical protein
MLTTELLMSPGAAMIGKRLREGQELTTNREPDLGEKIEDATTLSAR